MINDTKTKKLSILNSDKNIKVSVIINSFSSIECLKTMIKNCLKQTYKNIEIILYNFPELNKNHILEFSNNKKIKILKKESNLTSSISGNFVLFINSENFLVEDKSISEIINLWIKGEKPDILFFNCFSKKESEKKFFYNEKNSGIKNDIILNQKKDFFYYDLNFNLANTKCIYKSKFIKKVLTNLKNFKISNLMNLQFLIYAQKISLVTHSIVFENWDKNTSNNIFNSQNKTEKLIKDLTKIWTNIKCIISKNIKLNENFFNYYFDKKECLLYSWIKKEVKDKEYFYDEKFFDLFCKLFPKCSQLDILQKKLKQKNSLIENQTFEYDVTLIIPVYNTEKYIFRCLESIFQNKNNIKIQVIIIDDCSPGCIQNIYLKNLKKYTFIEIYKNKFNMGSLYSRIHGLLYAKGKWIHFVDSDDKVDAFFYEKIKNKKYKKVDCILGNWKYFWDDLSTQSVRHDIKSKKYKNPLDFYIKNIFLTRALWNKIFSLNASLKGSLEIIISNTSVSDDWLLNIAILSKCKNIKVTNENIYNYFYDNKNSISSNIEPKKFSKFNINCFFKNAEEENIKLVKYLDQRNRSYETIDYLSDKLVKTSKSKYYWGVNKFMDSIYVLAPLIDKQMIFFSECLSKSNSKYIPLDFSNIIKNNFYKNYAIDFLKKTSWNISPSFKNKILKLNSCKKLLYLNHKILSKIFKIKINNI